MRGRTSRILISAMIYMVAGGWAGVCRSTDDHAPAPQPTQRVTPQRAGLATLVDSIDRQDYSQRWELATIALDVLLDSYQDTLSESSAERPGTASRRAKLARWRIATQGLREDIASARLALLAGTDFDIYSDAQRQILILIEGQPIALTGLRRDDDRLIESTILKRYCANSDCSALQAAAGSTDTRRQVKNGHWLIHQGQSPTFEIDGQLRCRFADISRRQEKAAACVRAAREGTALRAALMQLERQAVSIDWSALATQRPRLVGDAATLVLNDQGDYLNWALPMLTRLNDSDWRNLLTALGAATPPSSITPVISQGERLLQQAPAR